MGATLFEPAAIGGMKLRNRLVRSATAECLTEDDGRLNDRYLRVYEKLARGGVGLIITGNFYVARVGQALPRLPVVDRDEVVADLRRVVDVAHAHGAAIVAQINHGGRQCNPSVTGLAPLAPSAVRDRLSKVKPRAMTEEQIGQAIAEFAAAARRVRDAGFDGVQLHAAHGYLIGEFLSPRTNRRRDRWGGPLENRLRFLLEVYAAVRAAVGADYPVLVKINGEDGLPRGATLVDCLAACRKLDEAGIAAIEISCGIAETGLGTIRGDVPRELLLRGRGWFMRLMFPLIAPSLRRAARYQDGYNVDQAAAVKASVRAPVIAVGGQRDRAAMERVLAAGQADFIALCRPFVRQPNLPHALERGERDASTCANCNHCSVEVAVHYNPLKCYRDEKETRALPAPVA